jgi:hypothetical protein
MTCKDHGRVKSLSPEGYALVGIPGVRSRCTRLHRLVYAETAGVALAELHGLVVRHKCDNPRCIEPTHLELGTLADNNKDRAERGRSAKHVPSRQRLSAEDVAAIQARYNPRRDPVDGVTALARFYGVDTNVIYRCVGGEYHVGA